MSYITHRALYKDMDKSELLSMRESGMSNAEIAETLGVSGQTVYRMIGKQPKEMTLRNRQMGGAASGGKRTSRRTNVEEDEPVHEAVLAVKRSDICLAGQLMHYVINDKRDMVEVENEHGLVLMQIKVEDIGTFVKELQAILRNVGNCDRLEVW